MVGNSGYYGWKYELEKYLFLHKNVNKIKTNGTYSLNYKNDLTTVIIGVSLGLYFLEE